VSRTEIQVTSVAKNTTMLNNPSRMKWGTSTSQRKNQPMIGIAQNRPMRWSRSKRTSIG
jgi:hypothetical protein